MWASLRCCRHFYLLLQAGATISFLVGLQVGLPSAGAQPPGSVVTDLLPTPLETLTPKRPRSEEDEDRLLAAAQFAHGRMLLQREQTREALSRFQRAFRNDPSPAIAREVITAAGALNHHAAAVRYAILAAEIHTTDADLSLKLAGLLAEQGDHPRALRLLEIAARVEPPLTGLNRVVLQAETMRLCLLTNQADAAAEAADQLRQTLKHPEQSGLNAADQTKLQGQRERLEPLMAESFLRAGRHADAEAVYRAMHEARPNESLLGFHLARLSAEQKNWKAARDHLQTYLRGNASLVGFEPYELLERIIAAETSDASRAKAELVSTLRQMRERDPNNNALSYFTAAQLLAADNLDEAARLYEELLTRQPTTTAYRQLAHIYCRKKDAAALLRVLSRAVDQAGVRELLDEEAGLIAKDADLMNQLLQRLENAQPGSDPAATASGLVGVALVALSGELIDVAGQMYAKAIAVPDADLTRIRETIGMTALVTEQNRFATEIFQQAIATNPPRDKLAAYHYYISGALAFAGETDQALAAAEKCARLKPDSVQFQARAAWVLYHGKRWEEAERRYRDLLKQFDHQYESEEVREQLRQARLVLSNICVLQKRLPEAEEWLEQVLDEFPEYVGALNDLGYLWADQGKRLNRALRMVERAVAAEPDNAAYRDSLGWAYYRLGRYPEAVRELERAATAAPDGIIFDHLGDAYLKLDDRAKAVAAWKKGAELMADPEEARDRELVAAKIKQYSLPTTNQSPAHREK